MARLSALSLLTGTAITLVIGFMSPIFAQTSPSASQTTPQPFPPPANSANPPSTTSAPVLTPPKPEAPVPGTPTAPVLTPPKSEAPVTKPSAAPVLTPPKSETPVTATPTPATALPQPASAPTTSPVFVAPPNTAPISGELAPVAKPSVPQGKLRFITVEIPGQGQVEVLSPKGDGTVLIKDRTNRSFRLEFVDGTPKLTPEDRSPPTPKPVTSEYGILSGSRVTYGQKDITAAYLVQPTAQYRHGALGDRIEADGVEVRDRSGKAFTYLEQREAVIEDVMPRLVDIDNDGRDEVIVVRSFIDYGSALAILGLRDGKLDFLAQSPAVGVPMRWMNPVGFADFDGDKKLEVVAVMMPHEVGILTLFKLQDGALIPIATANGFSNHVFGTQEPNLGAVVDMNGDGRPDIVVPDFDRRNLRIVTLWGDDFLDLGKQSLPAPFTGPMYPLYDKDGRGAVTFMANGKLTVAVGDGLPKTPTPPALGAPIIRPVESNVAPAAPKFAKPLGDVTSDRPGAPLSSTKPATPPQQPVSPQQPAKPPAKTQSEPLRPRSGIKSSDPK